jgi:uncharacterized lipoprotein YmbA
MLNHKYIAGILVICLTAALCAGCSRSPRVTFYTLYSEAKPAPSAAAGIFYSAVIGPVTIPELYDRSQLVVRVDANRVEILETHRWASPLKSEISRTIAENVSRQLKPSRIVAYPQNAGLDSDIRILVDIRRLDMNSAQGVNLEVLWSVGRSGGQQRRGESVTREAVSGPGNDALVAAFGRALATASSDIAEALRAETLAMH